MVATPPARSHSARRTQQERREKTEVALLTAAAELVVQDGVRSVTLARIGERAGYSRGIVTHQFGSKKAMLEALARTTQAGFVPGLADLPPGLEHMLRLIDGYIGALDGIGLMHRAFLLLWAEAATAPELAPIFRERDEAFRGDLRGDIAAGIDEGTVHPDTSVDDVAVAVVGQLRGIALQYLLDPGAVDTGRLRRAVSEYWRQSLGVHRT